MTDRAASVRLDEMKDLGDGGRVLGHPQLVVEEDRRDLRALEKILQIAVGSTQLLNPMAELAVDRGQFFVDQVIINGG